MGLCIIDPNKKVLIVLQVVVEITMMANRADVKVTSQAMRELQAILRKPYKDVCNVCNGVGFITKDSACPKCKGSGQRLLKLL